MGDLKNLRKYFHKYRNKHWMIISATLLGLLGVNNLAVSHGHSHAASVNNNYVCQDHQGVQQSVASSAADHAASQVSGLDAVASSASNMEQSIASNSNLPKSDASMFSSLTNYIYSSALNLGSQISASASASLSASVSASAANLQRNSHGSFYDTSRTYSVPNYNPGGSFPAARVALFNNSRVVWHDGPKAINLNQHDIQAAQVLSSIHSDNEVVYVTNLNGKVGYVYGFSKQEPQPLYLNQRYVYLSLNHQIMNVNTSDLADSRIIETIHYANSNLVKYCVSTKYGIGCIYINIPPANENNRNISNTSVNNDENKKNDSVSLPSHVPATVNNNSKVNKPHYTNDQKINILRSQIDSLIQAIQSDQKRIDSLLNLLHR